MPPDLTLRDYETTRSRLTEKEQRQNRLNKRLSDARLTLRSTERELSREMHDVDELERGSLRNLLLKLTRNHSDVLAREQEDVVRAKLLLDEQQQAAQHLEGELSELTREIISMRRNLQQLEQQIAQKKQILQADATHPYHAEEAELLDRQREELTLLAEIEEAEQVGRSLLRALDDLADELDQARKWASYDVWGGGLLSDVMKYNRLDEAEHAAYRVDLALRDYIDELRDVAPPEQLAFKRISSTERFIDFALDNIFTDLSVRAAIRENEEHVDALIQQVTRTQKKLQTQRQTRKRSLESLEQAHERLLLRHILPDRDDPRRPTAG